MAMWTQDGSLRRPEAALDDGARGPIGVAVSGSRRRRGSQLAEGRLGRVRRAHGDIPAGSYVVVERDGLAAAAAGWHLWVTRDDPRDGPTDGWNLWAATREEVKGRLEEMDVEWLSDTGRQPIHVPERMALIPDSITMRTPWSGLASGAISGMFAGLACLIAWYQPAAAVWIAIVLVAWLVGTARRMTARLTIDHDGVTVRNTWSRRRLAWDQIQAVGSGFPVSIWNVKNLALQAVAFRVRGRRFLLKATGTATLSDRRLLEELAAIRPWCLANGTPCEAGFGPPGWSSPPEAMETERRDGFGPA